MGRIVDGVQIAMELIDNGGLGSLNWKAVGLNLKDFLEFEVDDLG